MAPTARMRPERERKPRQDYAKEQAKHSPTKPRVRASRGKVARRRATTAEATTSPLHGFLSSVYAEIRRAAQEAIPSSQLTEVRDKLRQVRSVRYFRSSRGLQAQDFTSSHCNDQVVQQVLTIAARDFDSRNSRLAQRLNGCVSSAGYPLLSICLHSATFRAAISANHEDPDLSWTDIIHEVSFRKSSLQLFAITRKLDYLAPITHSDTHFRIFLDNKSARLSGMLPYGKTADKVGIERGDLEPIHNIDSGDCNPHVWALPLGRDLKAVRARITYSNTLPLIRDFPQHRSVAEFRNQKQEDILDSLVLLDKYTWPNKGSWPESDPRYAGYQSDACLACQECNETLDNAKPKDSTPCQSCGCTIKAVPDYTGTPAVELFTSERTGVAVRALEHIAKGRLLDPYVGEIYPSHKSDGTYGPRRYGGTQGTAYVFEVPIQNPYRVGSSSRMRKFAKNEWTHYVIDSAVKGNWTRYINHSCNPNTVFSKPQNIGGRNAILITAIRPIPFGEEITIDYGDEYFPPQGFGCKCGVGTCLAWNENELQFNDVMLEDAIRNGNAPGWAATKTGGRHGIAVPIENEVLYRTAKTKAIQNRGKREERDGARAKEDANEAATNTLAQTIASPALKKPANAPKSKPARAKTKTAKASTLPTRSTATPATVKGLTKMSAARSQPRQRNGQFASKTTGVKRQRSDTAASNPTQRLKKRSRK